MARWSRTAEATVARRAVLAVLLRLLAGGIAGAQVVTNVSDDGSAGSFRSVVEAAPANSTVSFDLGELEPTIALEVASPSGPVEIAVDLTIDGDLTTRRESQDVTLEATTNDIHLRLDATSGTDSLVLRTIDVNHGTGGIELDGTLIFETNDDVTVESQIRDVDAAGQRGFLEKEGPGTLTLRGGLPSGGTTIREGAVELESNTAGITGNFVNGGTLIFDVPDNLGSYDGVISDLDDDTPGSVEVVGLNTIRMSGAHSFTGGTTVSGAALIIDSTTAGANGALAESGDVSIDMNGTLEFELGEGATGIYTGVWINGDGGTLILDGESESALLDLTGLDGASTLGGTITVNRGTLAVRVEDVETDIDLGAATGDGTPNGAVLRLVGDGRFSRVLSGAGRIEVLATDRDGADSELRLSGNNTFTGTTTLTTGDLVVSGSSMPGDAIIASTDSRLIFDQGSDATYSGVISGMGGVEKRGSGTLSFDGAHTFLGRMSVRDGTLALRPGAALTGDVIVEPGAVLMGSGSLGGQTTLAGDLIADGMTVNGIHFAAGSRMRVGVAPGPAPTPNLVVASGQVSAEATALIDVEVASGDYSGAGVTLTLIQGGVTAAAADALTVVDDALFVETSTSLAGQSLALTVQGDILAGDIVAVATTANQRSVAPALEQLVVADDQGMRPDEDVFTALLGTKTGAASRLFASVGGESLSAFSTAHLATAQRFERGLHRRARGVFWGSEEAFFTAFDAPQEDEEPQALRPSLRLASHFFAPPSLLFEASGSQAGAGGDARLGAWTDAWGLIASVDGDGNSHDGDHELAGVSLGFDAALAERVLLGLAIGYTYAGLDVDGSPTDLVAHGIQTALYGSWSAPQGYASLAGRFAWARNESERELVIGTTAASVDADFDSMGYGVGLELGANLARLGAWLLQPVASFDWTRVERDSFSESGGGMLAALALRVDEESIDSLRTGLGLRASFRAQIDERSVWVPELRARWIHEFGDTERLVQGRFRSGTLPFSVEGAEADSDSFLAGLGWAVSLADQLRVHAFYDAIASEDALGHELGVTLRLLF